MSARRLREKMNALDQKATLEGSKKRGTPRKRKGATDPKKLEGRRYSICQIHEPERQRDHPPRPEGESEGTHGDPALSGQCRGPGAADEVTIRAPGLQRTGSGRVSMAKSASVSTEINLLGMTVDEGVSALEKYLDADACMAHLETVRIVHGKGTGARSAKASTITCADRKESPPSGLGNTEKATQALPLFS